MKKITICGSLKFENEIKLYSEKLSLDGNCVFSLIFPTKDKDKYTKDEIEILGKGHLLKIELSDAIFVVNKNGYIGDAVKKEIDYAKKHNKEIMYMEDI